VSAGTDENEVRRAVPHCPVNQLTFHPTRSPSRPSFCRSALHIRRRLYSHPSSPDFSLGSCRLRLNAFFLPSASATATAQSGALSRRADHRRIPRPARHSDSEYSLARPRLGGRGGGRRERRFDRHGTDDPTSVSCSPHSSHRHRRLCARRR
jgi:hypothetical protein